MSANNFDFSINGQMVSLSSRVKHKTVRKTQNIMTDWMLTHIDLETLVASGEQGEASIGEMLKAAITANPKLASEIQDLENSMILDQTIMLASNLDHSVLLEIKENAYEDEYIGLYEKSCELLGGNANNFFDVYRTGLTSRQLKERKEKGVKTLKDQETIRPE